MTRCRSTNQNAEAISVTPPFPLLSDTAHLSEVYSNATEGVVQFEKGPCIGAATRSEFRKVWSVQISAAPAKEIADGLVQQLQAKGYDSYIVQATVKGQNYYRVRVGRFNTRDTRNLCVGRWRATKAITTLISPPIERLQS